MSKPNKPRVPPEVRLWAHLQSTDTRWAKVGFALLNWGRRNVPETRDSYNPVKRVVAEIGLWMDTVMMRRVNRRVDREFRS